MRHWLSCAPLSLFLKTYFTRHHRHTPIIHLPTFNIVDCPTGLVFALTLIAAAYVPNLGLRARDVVRLLDCARTLTMVSDKSLNSGGPASLETLQALVLLGIMDRLMLKRTSDVPCSIDLGSIARLARAAHIFEVPNDAPNTSWREWATLESRRRLGLVLFAFDAFISVLHDQTPNVRDDELNMRFPSPEHVFMAASESEWRDANKLHPQHAATTYSVSLTLSSLFTHADMSLPLPDTLMGRFVLIHGILQYAWRTKRVLQENPRAISDAALQPYLQSRTSAICNSLRKWRAGWPEELLDFEPFSESPSLYQDRAEACWYLAGIVTLPHVNIRLPETSATDFSGALSVQQIFQCLILLSDSSLLHNVGQDFEATYHLVTERLSAGTNDGALGALIYREPDTTRAGFEE
ncbi:hypothetical protein CB0940_12215 [Cercospora beticola]|nr:hypothetical protein CB0940_12215 [Cercospora beticola]PIA80071.1 hypothetical protein CB0940_12215 [Cercospora beticola]